MRGKLELGVLAWSAVLAWAAAVGCNMVTGADDILIDGFGGAGGGGQTTTSTSSNTSTTSSTSSTDTSTTSSTSSTDTSTTSSTSSSTTTTSSTGTTDPWETYRQACVDRINELRATLGRSPYQRWVSAESCVDQQATHDQSVGIAHDAFANGTPACGGFGQNECPGWGAAAITGCLDSMWAERDQAGCSGCDACTTTAIIQGNCPNCSFYGPPVCGHYVNMSSASFTQVACGFSTDGSWAAQNFQ